MNPIPALQKLLTGNGHSAVIEKDLVRRCIGIIQDQDKSETFYRDSLQRIAAEFGVTSQLMLTVQAENNEETYVDLLLKIIRQRLETPQPSSIP